MTRSIFIVLLLVACNTRSPKGETSAPVPGAPSASDTIELRAARGELEATVRVTGPGHFVVQPAEGAALDVTAGKDSVKVTRDGAVVLSLDPRPNGMVGSGYRFVAPQRHGWIRILDDNGVTKLSAEPRPRGGTLVRDAGGSPSYEAGPEAERIVVQKARGGERVATVHGMPKSEDDVLAAVALAAPGLPLEVRAAALAFVLSR